MTLVFVTATHHQVLVSASLGNRSLPRLIWDPNLIGCHCIDHLVVATVYANKLDK